MNFFQKACDWIETVFFLDIGTRLKQAAKSIPIILGILEFIVGTILCLIGVLPFVCIFIVPIVAVLSVFIYAIALTPMYARGDELENLSYVPEIFELMGGDEGDSTDNASSTVKPNIANSNSDIYPEQKCTKKRHKKYMDEALITKTDTPDAYWCKGTFGRTLKCKHCDATIYIEELE